MARQIIYAVKTRKSQCDEEDKPHDKRMNKFLPRTSRTNTNFLLENHF